MKAFVSWSGGKDCMYALHLFLQNKDNEAACLLNMCEVGGRKSRSHGLDMALIGAQAAAMGIPLMQQHIGNDGYEQRFKQAVSALKAQGVTAGVFGDIYLDAHREWIERVCAEMNITPVFPLWQRDTLGLMRGFIADGFKTIAVAVRKDKLPKSFLGRVLDEDFLTDICSRPDADPCGENGEYHTFVFSGPLFSHPVLFAKGGEREDEKHWFLELETE